MDPDLVFTDDAIKEVMAVTTAFLQWYEQLPWRLRLDSSVSCLHTLLVGTLWNLWNLWELWTCGKDAGLEKKTNTMRHLTKDDQASTEHSADRLIPLPQTEGCHALKSKQNLTQA